MEKKYYPAGQIIYKEDSSDHAAFLIIRGKVKEYRTFKKQEIHIASYGKGSIFGERAVLTNTRRESAAIALKNTEVLVYSSKNLSKFFEKSPPIIKVIISSLSKRTKALGETVQTSPDAKTFTAVSKMLVLLFDAAPGHKIKKEVAIRKIKKVLNVSLFEIEQIIRKLIALQLIQSFSKKGVTFLHCSHLDQFMNELKAVLDKFGDSIFKSITPMSDRDLCPLSEIAEEFGLDPTDIAGKIADGSLPREFCFFNREEVEDLNL